MNQHFVKKSLFLVLLLLGFFQAICQSVEFRQQDFQLTGNTIRAGHQCFNLTSDDFWQGGGLWFKNRVDLNEAFSMELELFFGCDDAGADGIVFIFHPSLRTGFRGEGMGFGGLFPSFGIEMDTYRNPHLADPEYDHVALMMDGMTNHRRSLTDPVLLKAGVSNVEDCQNHKVKIDWDPNSQKVKFYFDGILRVDEKVDLVGEIFSDQSNVYWGFTSATGAKSNKHMVCIKKLEFVEDVSLSYEEQDDLLSGGNYVIKKLDFASGSTKLPNNAKPELNRLVEFFEKYPSHSIILDGFTDSSGAASSNAHISKMRAKAIADYLKSKGISSERIFYYGNGEQNPLYDNGNAEGRKKNRRVEVRMRILRV